MREQSTTPWRVVIEAVASMLEWLRDLTAAHAAVRCREDIVLDDDDRRRFEETLQEVVEKSGWILYAWILMSNHYHLAIKAPEPNLARRGQVRMALP